MTHTTGLNNYPFLNRPVRLAFCFFISSIVFTACTKTDYLNVDADNRPPLVAKIGFVNARPVNQGIDFYTYTTKVTATPLGMNKATPYINAQFGLVQINYTAAGSTSYLASRVFGGSADFTSTGGPNGPIAGYNHTVFAVKGKASNYTTDSLMLFYDDLAAPVSGNAKIRFVNLSAGNASVDVSFNGNTIFTNVAYGSAGGSILSGSGFNVYSIGPFKAIKAGTGNLELRSSSSGALLKLSSAEWDNLEFKDGKIYTIFINGGVTDPVSATALQHN